jgi:hypothetical protein
MEEQAPDDPRDPASGEPSLDSGLGTEIAFVFKKVGLTPETCSSLFSSTSPDEPSFSHFSLRPAPTASATHPRLPV